MSPPPTHFVAGGTKRRSGHPLLLSMYRCLPLRASERDSANYTRSSYFLNMLLIDLVLASMRIMTSAFFIDSEHALGDQSWIISS